MKLIPLTQGYSAMVDDSDYDSLVKYNWYTKFCMGKGYAARNERVGNKRVTVLMHNFITGVKNIDHRDSNGLNNQRKNLRPCTHGENMRNRPSQKGSSSKYKGVSKVVFHVELKTTSGRIVKYEYLRFISQINYNKKRYYVGSFKTEKEAAIAYNLKAKELHKDFAKLNLIQ